MLFILHCTHLISRLFDFFYYVKFWNLKNGVLYKQRPCCKQTSSASVTSAVSMMWAECHLLYTSRYFQNFHLFSFINVPSSGRKQTHEKMHHLSISTIKSCPFSVCSQHCFMVNIWSKREVRRVWNLNCIKILTCPKEVSADMMNHISFAQFPSGKSQFYLVVFYPVGKNLQGQNRFLHQISVVPIW